MDDTVSGKEIILEIQKSMRTQGEDLLYSTIVPARYEVYLHPDDYRRLAGVVPAIVAQARRALAEELTRINRGTPLGNRVREWLGRPSIPSERADTDWEIRILPDADEEISRGDIHVWSTLVLPQTGSYGGSRTRRIFTTRLSEDTRTQEGPTPRPAASSAGRVIATLTYEDETGARTYRLDQPHLVVGRGGPGYWVDLALKTVPDVSREHIRVRYDAETGRFYIKDTSTLGTTVNGAPIPSSVEIAGEQKSDRNIEVPLPPVAVIGLAGAVFLHFRAETAP